MNTSRKIEAGLVQLLEDCGLRGWIAAKSDQDEVTQGYPQTVISVSDQQAGETHPTEHMREATVDIHYAVEGEAQIDIDGDLAIIEGALADQDALSEIFNYAVPYVEIEDLRPVQGIHFNQTLDAQATVTPEKNQVQADFTATLAIQKVIDHP